MTKRELYAIGFAVGFIVTAGLVSGCDPKEDKGEPHCVTNDANEPQPTPCPETWAEPIVLRTPTPEPFGG